jgi:hypothetical protein
MILPKPLNEEEKSFLSMIKVGGLYKHYKNKMYKVLHVARCSETLELFVVYQACYETEFGKDTIWVRQLKMFLEEIMVDNKLIKRFELLEHTL